MGRRCTCAQNTRLVHVVGGEPVVAELVEVAQRVENHGGQHIATDTFGATIHKLRLDSARKPRCLGDPEAGAIATHTHENLGNLVGVKGLALAGSLNHLDGGRGNSLIGRESSFALAAVAPPPNAFACGSRVENGRITTTIRALHNPMLAADVLAKQTWTSGGIGESEYLVIGTNGDGFAKAETYRSELRDCALM